MRGCNALYFFCARPANINPNPNQNQNLNLNANISHNYATTSQKPQPHPQSQSKQKQNFIEWKQTLPFIPPVTGGEVIKVYDGDTITIASRLPYSGSPLYRFSVRLHGIDAPEIKGKNEDEKQAARVSQKALEDLVLHKNVTLQNISTEKYGRILADVYYNDINLSHWLLKHKYAIEYDGGTKNAPESWLQYQASRIID